jgi:hypothetical protein
MTDWSIANTLGTLSQGATGSSLHWTSLTKPALPVPRWWPIC